MLIQVRHGKGAKDRAIMEAGEDIDYAGPRVMVALVQNDGDLPFALAQNRLQPAQDRQISLDIRDLPLVAQRHRKAFEIAGGFVHVRLCHLDVKRAGGRVHHDIALRRGFADDLLVHLAFRRHIHDHIAHHLGLTAQAPPVDQPAHALIARLNLVPFRQRISGDGHAVLGKFAVSGLDLAFRAYPPPATDRV